MVDKYNREKLIHYLVSKGLSREEVEPIVKDFTNKVEHKAYSLGVKHYKWINKRMRIICREFAKKEYDEFHDKLVKNYPVELADEFINLVYAHLPHIG